MKSKHYLAFLLIMTAFSLNAFAISTPQHPQQKSAHKAQSQETYPNSTPSVQDQIMSLKNTVAEVRRDELNYRLDRNLLKDSYAANIQQINLILGLVLAVFTVLGFIGYKDISKFKINFNSELNELRNLRLEFEQATNTVFKDIEKRKDEIQSLINDNIDRDKRLKLLECKTKSVEYLRQRNFSAALTVIDEGLRISSKEVDLILRKGYCLGQLGQFSDAAELLLEIMHSAPQQNSILSNCLEYLLLAKQTDQYDELIKQQDALVSKLQKSIVTYLKILRAFVGNNSDAMKTIIREYFSSTRPEDLKNKGHWSFSEFEKFISSYQDSDDRRGISAYVKYISDKDASDGLVRTYAGIT